MATKRTDQEASRQAIVVLGMHRSGTSALARALILAGAAGPKTILPANQANEAGYWESAPIMELHDRMLSSASSRWDDVSRFPIEWFASTQALEFQNRAVDLLRSEYGDSPLFMLKDPRMCRTIPFWREALARYGAHLHFVILVRNPLEVAASLKARDGIVPGRGLLLWLRHMLEAERETRADPRVFVSYERLLTDWRSVLHQISEKLGVAWPRLTDRTAVEIERFLSARLRHHEVSPEELEARPEIVSWVKSTFCILEQAASSGKKPRASTLDRDHTLLREADRAYGPVLAESELKAEAELAERNRIASTLTGREQELERLAQSLAEHKQELESTRVEASAKEAELDRIARSLAEREEELGVARADASAKEAELDRIARSLAEREKELGVARADASAKEAELDRIARSLAQREEELGVARADASAKVTEFDRLAESVRSHADWIKHLERSRSWRTTRPLRAIGALVRRVLGRPVRQPEPPLVSRASGSSESANGTQPESEDAESPDALPQELDGDQKLVARIDHLERDSQGVFAPPSEPKTATEPEAATAEEPDEEARGDGTDVLARARLRAFLKSGAKLTFPKSAQPKVSVIVLSYQRPHLTYLTLESLLATEPVLEFEVVLVDNASSRETQALMGRLENVKVSLHEENLGFGPGNMVGARLARGDYICFLNNDTIATPGSLSSLVRVLDRESSCAAAGGRLIRLDGMLQEAGSILWSDGSCAGYGRGDDPEAAVYRYRRDVDFCSAACLLVRREVFHDVGGFDKRFAPAYYEDVDLCLSIREAGHRVVYEPASRVFHLEYGSSHPEAAADNHRAKRKEFVEKWGSRLASQLPPRPENLLAARDCREGRRLLVVDDKVPDSQLGSGFPRTLALLEALIDHGYVLTYLATADDREESPARDYLESHGVEVITEAPSIPEFLRPRADLYQLAIVSRPHNAHILRTLKALNPRIQVIYDAEAVFALRDVMQRAVAGKAPKEDEVKALIKEEVAQVDGADAVVTVSERERSVFAEHCGDHIPMLVWGHAVPAQPSTVPFERREDLLLVGNFETPPNADALEALVTELLPAVHADLQCRLFAVGSPPHQDIVRKASKLGDAVVMPGFATDLSSFYDRAKVFVAPHRFAGGIPLKVAEAMARGVPSVVSEVLAEQLGVRDEEQVLVSTDASSFAECVTRLYRDRELWERLQRSGYEFVRENFDPNLMRRRLIDAVEERIRAASVRPPVEGNGAGPRRAGEAAEAGSAGSGH